MKNFPNQFPFTDISEKKQSVIHKTQEQCVESVRLPLSYPYAHSPMLVKLRFAKRRNCIWQQVTIEQSQQ